MQLPGRLRSTTLGDLLGVLHRARLSGVLELREIRGIRAGILHRIHLVDGNISLVESPVTHPSEISAGTGFGYPEAARRSDRPSAFDASNAGRSEAPSSSTPSSAGSTPSSYGRTYASSIDRPGVQQRLDELFRLDDAEIAFRVARPRPAEVLSAPLAPGEYLHGRPRSRDRAASTARVATEHAQREGRDEDQERPTLFPPAPTPLSARARALALLGLRANATILEIQRTFRALAYRFHPDRFPHAGPRERRVIDENFAELTRAYHSLQA